MDLSTNRKDPDKNGMIWIPEPDELCWVILPNSTYFEVGSTDYKNIENFGYGRFYGEKLIETGRLYPADKEDLARKVCEEMNMAIKKITFAYRIYEDKRVRTL